MAKHNKQLLKELRNRVVNWKAVEQLQRLTFDARREKISTFKGMHAVNDMLEQFPYLEHEKVVRAREYITLTCIRVTERLLTCQFGSFCFQLYITECHPSTGGSPSV